MIRILLIRHATNDLMGRVLYGRMPGVLLNTEGLNQAERMARSLRSRFQLDAVFSGPLERAMQTANALAEANECAVTVDQGLTEIDFGSWGGLSFESLREDNNWRKFNQQRSTKWAPGGESMMEVQARAWTSMERIVATSAGDATVAAVTHGDVIRCLLMLLLGMPIDHIGRLEVAPSSVSEIQVGGDEPLIKNMNQILY
jgi:probable phosphoglycerate mutase